MSETSKISFIQLKKVLFIITDQRNLTRTIKLAEMFSHKTQTHVKFINAGLFYSSKFNYLLLKSSEILPALEESTLDNTEYVICREGDPFTNITEIINSSEVNLIIMQFPFPDLIEQEQRSDTSFGSTIDQLISKTFIENSIPLLLLNNNTTLLDEGFNKVVMLGTDWINTSSFNTIISLANKVSSHVHFVPYIKESHYQQKELDKIIDQVTHNSKKFIKEANDWFMYQNQSINLIEENLCKNKDILLEKLQLLNPEVIVFYVPKKEEIFEIFHEIMLKIDSSFLIVPEL